MGHLLGTRFKIRIAIRQVLNSASVMGSKVIPMLLALRAHSEESGNGLLLNEASVKSHGEIAEGQRRQMEGQGFAFIPEHGS